MLRTTVALTVCISAWGDLKPAPLPGRLLSELTRSIMFLKRACQILRMCRTSFWGAPENVNMVELEVRRTEKWVCVMLCKRFQWPVALKFVFPVNVLLEDDVSKEGEKSQVGDPRTHILMGLPPLHCKLLRKLTSCIEEKRKFLHAQAVSLSHWAKLSFFNLKKVHRVSILSMKQKWPLLAPSELPHTHPSLPHHTQAATLHHWAMTFSHLKLY